MTSPVLELRGIDKRFAGVHALQDVNLALYPGEVHALMGQNGAGKSTLIKVLTGVVSLDAGEILLEGRAIHPDSPLDAQKLGISTVYQEVNLCPNLSVAENIFAGYFPRRGALHGYRIDWDKTHGQARELLARIGLDIDVTRVLTSYSVAVQQMVAIARALKLSSKVLILDEPTSSLDDDEVRRLFDVLRRLREQGLAILFVTHFLNQVYAISDRITVLRNSRRVGEWPTSELGAQALIAAMLGRELAAAQARQSPPDDIETATQETALLDATRLGQKGQLQPLDLRVRAGEVVGVAGLLGSGRTELAKLLFGLEKPDEGELRIDGMPVSFTTPAQAIRHGIAFCPEERKADGIVAELSLRENIALALQARMGARRCLTRAEQNALAERFVRALGIKAATLDMPIGLLSGGNQQKALIARWLATEPRLLILDEPTRGIDVAAKQEIMDEILRLASTGMAVLFISSEISEVVRIANRIVVLRDRRKVGELPAGTSEDTVCEMIGAEHG
ncbi:MULTISPECIES: sugar ABC transporter ATP-binding protein [Caballeronia]|jgi:galactofuranose transport system ATP-binding protein|uniref:Sugar ABC transporter ATP-binding protein n=1 Tax=Caballeronia zhejiangensis TaxID=871203 RepID=A0A656QR97_9BURK|nr:MULTISPECIES: sugar ABC transporter ATP-binding protein [Caballeronia]KDR33855.1 sugar ABC transporter ATP-binding protein [Caballeronia zhejiangensis]MCG7403787.1 sugar ABC transporter ATP-binding protein [Caballeronia zhejiangensis]MCI1044749.1 sugar ABC transporter ATP-binding protein [Caballeronia zhejiangensis]MDR5766880.1 sugar ABC transporter ATP-binding protein [Caballeronia sp. LZ028]MDR5788724.1 sugar ABC transporter ATP-binding protein [Caballeronia sp. LP003]